MRYRYRETRNLIILIFAAGVILSSVVFMAFDAIVKTDEQRDCQRWARQYGHDYCND